MPQLPSWSWSAPGVDGASRPGYLVRVARGLLWRFALVGAATLGALISPAVPLAVAVGALVVGQLIALRRTPATAAPLWRTGLIALALAISLSLPVFPKVVAAGLVWVGVEPWIVAGGPWRPRLGRLRARITGSSGQLDDGLWGGPASLEPPADGEGWW